MVLVLLSASVERLGVSRMRDFPPPPNVHLKKYGQTTKKTFYNSADPPLVCWHIYEKLIEWATREGLFLAAAVHLMDYVQLLWHICLK